MCRHKFLVYFVLKIIFAVLQQLNLVCTFFFKKNCIINLVVFKIFKNLVLLNATQTKPVFIKIILLFLH